MNRALALAAAALAASCATTGPFTRPEELEAIAAEPLPEARQRKVVSVAEWELDGPLPERVEHVPLADTSAPFARVVLEAAAGRFRLAEDLTCVARQRARFALAHDGAAPGVLLRDFIAARCGCPSLSINVWELHGEVPDDVTDAEVASRWGPEVAGGLGAVPAGAWAGVALARRGGKARLILAFALDAAHLEPLPIFPDTEVVRVRGTVLRAAEDVWGRINQGADASAPCVRNPAVKLPDFELACPVKGGNPHDWLGVWVREPGRFLGQPVFTTMVWQPGTASQRFVRPSVGLMRDGSIAAFVEGLNAQRLKLGLEPVRLSEPQSAQVRALVAPYVEAELHADLGRLDRIAMGLIAGWRVEQAITEGHFTSSAVPAGAAEELLAELLELPGGRHRLLAAETSVLAIGQVERGGVIESIICSYSALGEAEPPLARQQALIDRLNAERAKRGVQPAQWVQLPTQTAQTVAAAVRARQLEPEEALTRLMNDAMQVIHQGVRGWHVHTSSLDDFAWPDELLTRPTLQVMMTIVPWRRSGAPWTEHVLLLVLFEGAATDQA